MNVTMEKLSSFPANSNPYHYDLERVGFNLGSMLLDDNLRCIEVMGGRGGSFVLVDHGSGARMQFTVTFPEEEVI